MPDARQIFFHHLGIIPVSAADVAALEDRRLDAAPVKLFAGGEHHGIDNVEPDDARHRAGLDLAVHGDDRVAMGHVVVDADVAEVAQVAGLAVAARLGKIARGYDFLYEPL